MGSVRVYLGLPQRQLQNKIEVKEGGAMRLIPFDAPFGAKITGLELANLDRFDPRILREIEDAVIKYKVIKIVNQELNPRQLARLAAKFGESSRDPFIDPVSEDVPVIEVKRDRLETTPIFGGDWHSDWSFKPEPPKYSFLYGHLIPPAGGRTIFADCVQAFEKLPQDRRTKMYTLRAIHSARRAYGRFGLFSKDDSSRAMKINVSEQAERVVFHPAVRYIKESGEEAVFINPAYTVGMQGVSGWESAHLIENVCAHLTSQEFQLPITWAQGNLLVWDNRTVVHSAEGGYEGHQRVMYRMTVGRERPVSRLI